MMMERVRLQLISYMSYYNNDQVEFSLRIIDKIVFLWLGILFIKTAEFNLKG